MLPYGAGSGPTFLIAKPLVDDDGKILLDRQDHPLRLSIAGGSANRELAWEFIKYAAQYDHADFMNRRSSASDDSYAYPMYSFRNYVPIYKPSLTQALQYTLAGSGKLGISSYGNNIKLFEEERAEWLAEYIFDALNREMTYHPDIWQIREVTKIIYTFAGNLKRSTANISTEDLLKKTQNLYEKLVVGDPEMKWTDEYIEKIIKASEETTPGDGSITVTIDGSGNVVLFNWTESKNKVKKMFS